jgi:hypothetical protein
MARRVVTLQLVLCLLLSLAVVPGWALVETANTGRWPADWPEELEPFRGRAQTTGVATGLQMNIYQIPFETHEEFQSVWPVILDLKSKGGTLTLSYVGSEAPGWPGCSNEEPCVRIHAPSGGVTQSRPPEGVTAPEVPADPTYQDMQKLVEAGMALNAAPPWPESAYLPNGDLSEYVASEWVDGRLTWLPAEIGAERGFLHRARVDIELVVDGDVIDLNFTHIPDDTRIIDKRGLLPHEEQEE